jgi:hypothetical protein
VHLEVSATEAVGLEVQISQDSHKTSRWIACGGEHHCATIEKGLVIPTGLAEKAAVLQRPENAKPLDSRVWLLVVSESRCVNTAAATNGDNAMQIASPSSTKYIQ